MGLDRISLKPILSPWSGRTVAGSDGKLFVVKLISLLSPSVQSTPTNTTCPHLIKSLLEEEEELNSPGESD